MTVGGLHKGRLSVRHVAHGGHLLASTWGSPGFLRAGPTDTCAMRGWHCPYEQTCLVGRREGTVMSPISGGGGNAEDIWAGRQFYLARGGGQVQIGQCQCDGMRMAGANFAGISARTPGCGHRGITGLQRAATPLAGGAGDGPPSVASALPTDFHRQPGLLGSTSSPLLPQQPGRQGRQAPAPAASRAPWHHVPLRPMHHRRKQLQPEK
jgi:hypothetical protein